MPNEVYSSVVDQVKIKRKLRELEAKANLDEVLFLTQGDKIAFLTSLVAGRTFWRAGFRGFNLHKFGRYRITTTLFVLIFSTHSYISHKVLVTEKLWDEFRPESSLNYALKSLAAHQIGLISVSFGTIGSIFALAQRFGVIPVPHNMFDKEVRPSVFRYIRNSLRPYAKPALFVWLASSAFMTAVGIREYQESCDLLSKIGRKTIALKEN